MKLAELIRKGGLAEVATATHATIATHEPIKPPTVAPVATVAVADSQKSFDHDSFDECAESFVALCTMPRPAAYTPERWQQIVSDAKAFRDLWHSQAEGLGWKPETIFTLRGGLIPLIEGGDVLAICERTAVIRSLNRKQFNTCRFTALPDEVNQIDYLWTGAISISSGRQWMNSVASNPNWIAFFFHSQQAVSHKDNDNSCYNNQ